MSLIGSFPASGSQVFNLDFLPENVLVVSTGQGSQGLSNFSVVCAGQQLMSITDAARVTALAKFDAGAVLNNPTAGTTSKAASWIKLSTGRINKAATITGTNAIAAVRNFFATSTNISNVARRAVEQSINPSANATFDNFEALFFDTTNVIRAQITFDNGFTDEYATTEILALYAKYHVAEEDGFIQGLGCIDSDSGAGKITQVVLYAGAGAAVVVLKTDYVVL